MVRRTPLCYPHEHMLTMNPSPCNVSPGPHPEEDQGHGDKTASNLQQGAEPDAGLRVSHDSVQLVTHRCHQDHRQSLTSFGEQQQLSGDDVYYLVQVTGDSSPRPFASVSPSCSTKEPIVTRLVARRHVPRSLTNQACHITDKARPITDQTRVITNQTRLFTDQARPFTDQASQKFKCRRRAKTPQKEEVVDKSKGGEGETYTRETETCIRQAEAGNQTQVRSIRAVQVSKNGRKETAPCSAGRPTAPSGVGVTTMAPSGVGITSAPFGVGVGVARTSKARRKKGHSRV